MKFVQMTEIVAKGPYAASELRSEIEADIYAAISAVVWPRGSKQFTIRPGKHINGVKPMKNGFVSVLIDRGWEGQKKYPKSIDPLLEEVLPGAFDVSHDLGGKEAVVAEWETGNVSSSHRSVNRMARAIMEGHAVAGYLVVSSRDLYPHLTDRIGNFRELTPYFGLWSKLPLGEAVLAVIEVEHDAVSRSVRPIPKGKDGNAIKAL